MTPPKRTPVICMLMADRGYWQTHAVEVPKPDFPYKSDLHIYHTVPWNAEFRYIAPLDRWDWVKTLPHTLVSVGSLPQYLIDVDAESARLILDPDPAVWLADRPWTEDVLDRIPYETVEIPKRRFCWHYEGLYDKSWEMNFCAGSEELKLLLHVSAFVPVYPSPRRRYDGPRGEAGD